MLEQEILYSVYLFSIEKSNIILHCINKRKQNFIFRIFEINKNTSIDIEFILSQNENFIDYFPIVSAIRRKIVTKIGKFKFDNFKIPIQFLESDVIRYNNIGFHILNKSKFKSIIVNISKIELKNTNKKFIEFERVKKSEKDEFDFVIWEDELIKKCNEK